MTRIDLTLYLDHYNASAKFTKNEEDADDADTNKDAPD